MKFSTVLSLSALAALTTALPQPDNTTPDITPIDIGPIPPMPSTLKDGAPVTSTAGDDSDPEKRSVGLQKRDFTINIWQDPDRQGRHQALHVAPNRCYNLGNGWNNAISSLHVSKGHGCVFYKAKKCPQHGTQLTVPGSATVLNDLKNYHFNDQISSFLCYNN